MSLTPIKDSGGIREGCVDHLYCALFNTCSNFTLRHLTTVMRWHDLTDQQKDKDKSVPLNDATKGLVSLTLINGGGGDYRGFVDHLHIAPLSSHLLFPHSNHNFLVTLLFVYQKYLKVSCFILSLETPREVSQSQVRETERARLDLI